MDSRGHLGRLETPGEEVLLFWGSRREPGALYPRSRPSPLSPARTGGELNYFIYPYVDVDGVEFTQVTGEFSYRDLPGLA